MPCETCKKGEMEKVKVNDKYHYCESGLQNVWLVGLEMNICPKCESRTPIFSDMELLTRCITKKLVCLRGRLNGASVLFLRKAMRLKASELAKIIGVDRVTISRWENDKVVIDPYRDFKLRMEAIDRILPLRERRSARENVSQVLQHTYRPEISVADLPIDLPIEAFRSAS